MVEQEKYHNVFYVFAERLALEIRLGVVGDMNSKEERITNARHAKKYGGVFSLAGYGSGMLQIVQTPVNTDRTTIHLVEGSKPDSTCKKCGFVLCDCGRQAEKVALLDHKVEYQCAACEITGWATQAQLLAKHAHGDARLCEACSKRRDADRQIRYGLFTRSIKQYSQVKKLTRSFVSTLTLDGIACRQLRYHLLSDTMCLSRFASGDIVQVISGYPHQLGREGIINDAIWTKYKTGKGKISRTGWVYQIRTLDTHTMFHFPQEQLRSALE